MLAKAMGVIMTTMKLEKKKTKRGFGQQNCFLVVHHRQSRRRRKTYLKIQLALVESALEGARILNGTISDG